MASIAATQQQLVAEINSIKQQINSTVEIDNRGNDPQILPAFNDLPETFNSTAEHVNTTATQEQFSVAAEKKNLTQVHFQPQQCLLAFS